MILGFNQLKTIPHSIGLLSTLEILDLGKNHLVEIPESIGALKSLKYLYLYYNFVFLIN